MLPILILRLLLCGASTPFKPGVRVHKLFPEMLRDGISTPSSRFGRCLHNGGVLFGGAVEKFEVLEMGENRGTSDASWNFSPLGSFLWEPKKLLLEPSSLYENDFSFPCE